MLKRILFIAILTGLGAVRIFSEPQVFAPAGNPVVMTGSAIRFVTNPSTAAPFKCNSMMVEPLAGNTAVIYILNAAPNITMSLNGAGTTTVAQLGFNSTQPSPSMTFPSNGSSTTQAGGFDMRYWGAVGTASDQLLVSCDKRN